MHYVYLVDYHLDPRHTLAVSLCLLHVSLRSNKDAQLHSATKSHTSVARVNMPVGSLRTGSGHLRSDPLRHRLHHSLCYHRCLLAETAEVRSRMAHAQAEVNTSERDEEADARRETRPLHRPLLSSLLHTILDL